MRKALTIPALALATSMALGGATTAFAADSPAPQAGSTTASPAAATASLKLSAATAEPGDTVTFELDVPPGSTHIAVSSKALTGVRMTEGHGGAAKVAQVADGSYGVSLTGTGPDGAKLQATAQLTVKDGAPEPPAPTESGLKLSTDFGRPGDKVTVTIRTGEKNAFVKSGAFTGGQVDLKSDGHGTFTGTATVAKDVKSGYYGVDAFAGGKKFDTVKFSTEGASTPAHTNHDRDVKPLNPGEHRTPRGSVNTGQAPAADRLPEADGNG